MKQSSIALASVSILAMMAVPAHGQSSVGPATSGEGSAHGSQAPIGTDEIVVTANKRAQVLTDVGLAVAVLDSSALETRNVTSVEGLANVVPGLTVGQSGYSTPIFSLRGIGSNEATIAAGSSVTVYVDEVPLTLPVMTRGATLDLERVEVLKGPQGTLYGQNATGGTINYIAAKPTDDFQAGVTGTYGRFNNVQAEGYVSGPLGDTLKGRVAIRAERQFDGWQKSVSRPDDRIGKTKKFAGRAILQWEPADTIHMTFNANGWVDKSDTFVPQLYQVVGQSGTGAGNILNEVVNAPAVLAPLNRPDLRTAQIPLSSRVTDWDASLPLAGDGGATDPNRRFRSNDWFWQGSVRGDWEFADNVTLTSITAYMKSRVRAFREQDGIGTALATFSTTVAGNVLTFPAGRDINAAATDSNNRTKSFSQELRLAAEFGPINWIFGANYLHETSHEFNAIFLQNFGTLKGLPLGGYDDSAYTNNQRIRSWGVFTNVEAALTDQITLVAGLRLSEEKRSFNGCGSQAVGNGAASINALVNLQRAGRGLPPLSGDDIIVPGDCAAINASFIPAEATGLLKQSNTPWNVTLNFKPADRTLIYGRIARGFKSGNFPSFGALNNASLTPVKQESLIAYEMGFKSSPSRLISVEGAVFRYDYTDKQQRGREDTGIPFGLVARQVNIPKSRVDGGELSITLRPIEGLTLAGSGTYLKSKILEYTGFNADGVRVNARGAQLNFVPKYSVNLDVNYTTPINDRLDVFAGGNMAYRSKQVAQIASASRWDIDAYTLFDAQLGIADHDGRWRVWAFGKNITGKYYWTNVIKTSDMVLRFPGMPATYGLSASFKFR